MWSIKETQQQKMCPAVECNKWMTSDQTLRNKILLQYEKLCYLREPFYKNARKELDMQWKDKHKFIDTYKSVTNKLLHDFLVKINRYGKHSFVKIEVGSKNKNVWFEFNIDWWYIKYNADHILPVVEDFQSLILDQKYFGNDVEIKFWGVNDKIDTPAFVATKNKIIPNFDAGSMGKSQEINSSY